MTKSMCTVENCREPGTVKASWYQYVPRPKSLKDGWTDTPLCAHHYRGNLNNELRLGWSEARTCYEVALLL